MFSPIGKKKILLQQKFSHGESSKSLRVSMDELSIGSLGRIESPKASRSPTRRLDSPGGSLDSAESIREIRQKLKVQPPMSAVASTVRLEESLMDVGSLGAAMRKVLDGTTRYRPERDSILLKAFESRTIEYSLFKQYLNSALWLSFTPEEFQALTNYFDPSSTGIIDGYGFLKAFVRLNAIRKDQEGQIVREKQEIFEKNLKDEEERKKLEKQKLLLSGVDYNFTSEIKYAALEKLQSAAKKFDPGHPSAASTSAFTVSVLKPAEFRELMKLVFNLKLDPKEVGAILKNFKPDIENDVPANDFLKYFLRLGFDAREKEKVEHRKLQELLDKKTLEEKLKKEEEEAKNKLQYSVDYNYSEEDEKSALKKFTFAAEKYDKSLPGSVALDGFECDELPPLEFKDLIRRVFNLSFLPSELGFIVQKYDVNKSGRIHCKTFITEFLQTGYEERHRKHINQLEKQKRALEKAEMEHLAKIKAVQEDEKVAISSDFEESDLQSALKKLAQASVFFDKTRGIGLSSFEPESLSLVEFKRGLKRTFNIEFSAKEMGAIHNYLQKDSNGKILCHPFIVLFTSLGSQERGRIRTEQLNRQRSLDLQLKEEIEKRQKEISSKVLYEVDFNFDPEDKHTALEKVTIAAKKFDPKHPAAMSLNAFEVKHMSGPEFKETVRKTFHLNLNAKEVGAIFSFVRDRLPEHESVPRDCIHCGEFIKYFLQLGVSERLKSHKEQLEKQRFEDLQREETNRQKLLEQSNRGTYQPDMTFTEEDIKSIEAKVAEAAEKFDRTHPAAPSLESFTTAFMFPGVFRENIKSVFGIRATPKEIGYLLQQYDKDKSGRISTKDFLIRFFALGNKIRDEKKKNALTKQRDAQKRMQQENEEKLNKLVEKSDYEIDNDFTEADFSNAVVKMTQASEKYDKTHPSAPNLDGFSGGPVAPGIFRELMKRAFNIYLSPKEVGAIVHRFHTPASLKMIDGKQFLIFFMRLGFEAKSKRKAQVLMNERQARMHSQQEKERKLMQSLARVDLDLATTYTDIDREKAMAKLVAVAALYDKNAPGSVSLDSFHASYLTPGMFREVMKKTFNLLFTPAELAAMIAEFNNGMGNIDTNKFLVRFIKMGSEERDRLKALQLEKDRNAAVERSITEKRKLQEQEQKMLLKINYNFTPQQEKEAFRKLAIAAKKYDKSHPAAMTLEGFDQKSMKPHIFREMLKRTFNFTPTAEELGAIFQYFDRKKSGELVSQDFLVYFLKLGIAEREREHKESLKKLRQDASLREKLHQDKMAAQWAKTELQIEYEFSEEQRASALEKLTEAAVKYDPSNAGPMGLTAFQASTLPPAVFRELLRRVFGVQLSGGELAALIKEFDKDNNKQISCSEFLVKFQLLGSERKNQQRAKQLEKQRFMSRRYELEMQEKKRQLDEKCEIDLDFSFSQEEFDITLQKIRELAVRYDKTHPSAPNLRGFQGADMKPNEFKDMMLRTFHIHLNKRELAALFSFFPGISTDTGPSPSQEMGKEGASPATLICSRDFLSYFYKINREEAMKRHSHRILQERSLKARESERNREREREKSADFLQRLKFDPSDEVTCFEKIKAAAQEFAIDSAPFIDLLQRFKGPALPPDKFRELFQHTFNIRLKMAEVGFLLSLLDSSNLRMMEGSKFLNWFYKIARKVESFLLGETSTEVTLAMLKSDSAAFDTMTITRSSTALSRSGSAMSPASFTRKGMNSTTSSRSVSPPKKRKGNDRQSVSQPDFGFSRSSSFEMENPMKREVPTSPSNPHRPLRVRHLSLEFEKQNPKYNKFQSSYTSKMSESFDPDLDSFTSENESFSRSTVSQQWYLPSIWSLDNETEPKRALSSDLKQIFEKTETLQLDLPEPESSSLSNSYRLLSTSSTAKTSSSSGNKRKDKRSLKLPVQSITTSQESQSNNEANNSFLQSIFAETKDIPRASTNSLSIPSPQKSRQDKYSSTHLKTDLKSLMKRSPAKEKKPVKREEVDFNRDFYFPSLSRFSGDSSALEQTGDSTQFLASIILS